VSRRQKRDTDLGILVVRNMATVMEREREKRRLSKNGLARLCEITGAYYLGILDGSANPSIHIIARISTKLNVSLDELIMGRMPTSIKATPD